MPWRTSWARVCLCGCILTAVLAAQEPPAPAPAPTFHTEADYVRVDVYPTRDGRPVADLTAQDFDVFENGAPQKIEQFERVTVRAAGPQDTRREPSTVEESRQAATDPRARVFVLFLDIDHVERGADRRIQQSLIDVLNRLIGQDDLVAVMTPEMSARDLTFSRRTTILEGILASAWGGRERLDRDPTEQQYAYCYPGIPNRAQALTGYPSFDQGIAQEMILRRREKRTLDALLDTVRAMRDLREERKALITISDGWRLFTPSDALLRPIDAAAPDVPTLGIDPRTGRPTTDRQSSDSNGKSACERDRLALAALDNRQEFREIQDEANRANASFYPVDPRGLVVRDEQLIPSAGVGMGRAANPTLTPVEDQARLTERHDSLRALADATDGVAILETNNMAAGLRRIADDLNAYYLLGYYTTAKLDGKFHAITVRVKRPGVQVRARRGYLAASTAAVSAVAAAKAPPAGLSSDARMLQAALGSLSGVAREDPLLVHLAAGWTGDNTARVWAVAEAAQSSAAASAANGSRRPGGWPGGGEANATLIDAGGSSVASAVVTIAPGSPSALLVLVPAAPLAPGDYDVRIRTSAVGTPGASTMAAKITIEPGATSTGALFVRRGPTTGNKEVATADLRFRRSDRLRVEVPARSEGPVTGRLLDRRGTALALPVTAAARTDADGASWLTAELALAPLAPGDYVAELGSGERRTLAAFRVVP